MPRTSNLCFDGERVFVVTQPKRDRGQHGYDAPFDNGFQNRKALATQTPMPFGAPGSRYSATTTSTCGSSSIAATCSAVVSMCRHASAILMNADRHLLGTSNVIASLSTGFRRPRVTARQFPARVVMSTSALGAFFGQAFAASRSDLTGTKRTANGIWAQARPRRACNGSRQRSVICWRPATTIPGRTCAMR